MLKTYAYWENAEGTEGHFQEDQEDTLDPTDTDGIPMWMIYILKAETFEEAMAVHNLRMGFSPYQPMGEPIKCPQCSHGYYYLGSGKCFCGYKYDEPVFTPCCETMTDQINYTCDKHKPTCPNQIVALDHNGLPSLRAENGEYYMSYCPWCGKKIEKTQKSTNG